MSFHFQPSFSIRVPEDIDFYMLFFYNKGQMYLPNPTKIFGSEFLLIDLPDSPLASGNDGKYQYYAQDFRLTQVHWKALDYEKQRCDTKTSYRDENNLVSECIVGYLEKKIGCSMGLKGSKNQIERLIISL